jgi:hypothetical protein
MIPDERATRKEGTTMATTRFDAVTSSFAQTHSRRGAFRLLGLAALSASGLAVLNHEEGQAKKKRKKKSGKPASSGSTGSTTNAPSQPADMCPVSAKTNAPVCGNDPDGECSCHRAVEGNNFCSGQLNTCAGLRACSSTADCRESVGFHFVCQAADGGACGQVCVPECENRYPS